MTVSSCFSEKSQHTGMSICNFLCLHVIDTKRVSKIVCVCVCLGWLSKNCTCLSFEITRHHLFLHSLPHFLTYNIHTKLVQNCCSPRRDTDLQYCSFRPHYDFSSKGWPRIIIINISNVCTHSAFCHTQHNLNLCLCVCPFQGELQIINSGLQCLQCIDVPHPVFNPVTPDLLSWFKTLCHLQVDVYC